MEFSIGVLVSAVFITIAFVVNNKNARYLLSGYNTMTEEKKSNFDLDGYLKVFKRFFILLGTGSLVIFSVLYFVGLPAYGFIAITIIPFLGIPYLIIKGQEFDHNKRKYRWLPAYLTIGVVLIVAIGVAMLAMAGMKENEFIVTQDHIEIKGMYGEIIPLQDVESAALVAELPTLTLRTNGFALAKHLKGYFQTVDGKTVKLYVNAKYSPYIELRTDAQTYYWNVSGDKTKEVFESLESMLK